MEFLALNSDVSRQVPWQLILLSCLLSFLLAQIIAVTYERTYQGMSYSRALFQSLALISILSSMLMFAIGNSLARGLGIAGVFAIIRFRTNLRDPRDIVFIFASLSIGIGCGIQAFGLAIAGTVVFCAAAFYLRYVPLGVRQNFDGLLRFSAPSMPEISERVEGILKESCQRFSLVTMREVAQGERLEFAYQVKLKDTSYTEAIVFMIRHLEDVRGVSLMMQETTVEL
ncbi:MAG TPA: DUF4956 domain-containing protein [Myxococcales bacterium]|nr:DUF4956 domain-containing protein [Deltaproteobacteria bacterium]HAA54918.1 DUF4956 domain-containing protein [Myxococcales bacterium]|tara:strand:- start:9095 stop:9778 length:684 start_codon:yes stop_codon:yes gene_type:complete